MSATVTALRGDAKMVVTSALIVILLTLFTGVPPLFAILCMPFTLPDVWTRSLVTNKPPQGGGQCPQADRSRDA